MVATVVIGPLIDRGVSKMLKGGGAQIFHDEIEHGLRSIGINVTAAAQQNIVQPKYGRYAIQAFGPLLQSMGFRMIANALRVEIGSINGPGKKYAYWVHEGRSAGRAPPMDKLLLWVKLKFGLTGAAAKKLAYRIAIKQKFIPVPARRFLWDAMEAELPNAHAILKARTVKAAARINARKR